MAKPNQALAQLVSNDRLFFETLLFIEDRNGQVIKFSYNPAQEIMDSKLTNRDLVLKASQLGSTTMFLAKGFKQVITVPNTTAVVVAHEEFFTQRLLRRVDTMYNRLPLSASMKPKRHHVSAYEHSFPTLNSTMFIGTAGAKVLGRGEPIHFFHGSEIAFWPDPWRILIPTMQRVPLDGYMVLESTPNGEGTEAEPNAMYSLVQEALSGDSLWNLIVLPWWTEPEYRIPAGSKHAYPSDREKIKTFADDELALIKRAGWGDEEADERIRWRRRKIREIKSAFWQEFFEDIVSCFISVKEPFYDYVLLDRWRGRCYEPEYVDGQPPGARVWFPPAPYEDNPVYGITVDPGQGKATRSVAYVWRFDLDGYQKVRLEAEVSGLLDPDAFAPMVKALGEYYYWARIAPEANGHGMAFCARVSDYPNLYWRTDVVSGLMSKEIGWKTTGAARIGAQGTKMYAMTELQAMMGMMEVYDINLVREMSMVKYAGSNVEFLGSDDRHDAAMIMAATRMGMPSANRGYLGSAGFAWNT